MDKRNKIKDELLQILHEDIDILVKDFNHEFLKPFPNSETLAILSNSIHIHMIVNDKGLEFVLDSIIGVNGGNKFKVQEFKLGNIVQKIGLTISIN